MAGRKLWWVGLYALGMAYVEAAVVVYLRRLFGIGDLMLNIAPFDPVVAAIEFGRELATMVMLLAVGWAVGNTLQTRCGFAVFAFGIWDIGYYGWLKVLINWPASLIDFDFLFTIPLPWWGPVIAPMLVALTLTIFGALAVIDADRGQTIHLSRAGWGIAILGVLGILYSFMADALASLPASPAALSQMRPRTFNWLAYGIGLALMAWATLRAAWPGRSSSH